MDYIRYRIGRAMHRTRNREVISPPIGKHEINALNMREDRMCKVLAILNIQEENYSEEGGKSIKQLAEETKMKRDKVSMALRLLKGRGKAFVGAKNGYRRSIPLWFKAIDGEAKYHMK